MEHLGWHSWQQHHLEAGTHLGHGRARMAGNLVPGSRRVRRPSRWLSSLDAGAVRSRSQRPAIVARGVVCGGQSGARGFKELAKTYPRGMTVHANEAIQDQAQVGFARGFRGGCQCSWLLQELECAAERGLQFGRRAHCDKVEKRNLFVGVWRGSPACDCQCRVTGGREIAEAHQPSGTFPGWEKGVFSPPTPFMRRRQHQRPSEHGKEARPPRRS